MTFNKQLVALYTALSIVALFSSSSLAEHEDIIWGVNSSPPFHIFDGKYEEQGFCDALVSSFQRQLLGTVAQGQKAALPPVLPCL